MEDFKKLFGDANTTEIVVLTNGTGVLMNFTEWSVSAENQVSLTAWKYSCGEGKIQRSILVIIYTITPCSFITEELYVYMANQVNNLKPTSYFVYQNNRWRSPK